MWHVWGGERRWVHQVLLGKLGGTRSLGRLRPGLEDNIKIDIEEVEWGGMDWIDLAQDRDR
jgi:hypothetical protein